METIREGRIVIHLEQGRVELKAPQLDALVKAREREAEAVQRAAAEQEKLNRLYEQGARIMQQQEAVQAHGGAGGPGGPGGGMERAARAAEDYQRKIATANREALDGFNMASEGAMRTARAVVLLGASGDESFQKMIRGLALVQAGYDLLRGPLQLLLGLEKAMMQLAAAETVAAGAATLNAGAHTRQAAAMGLAAVAGRALAGIGTVLAAVFSPLGILIGAIGGIIWGVIGTIDNLVTTSAEAAEAEAKLAEEVQKHIKLREDQLAREREVLELRRSMMTDAEKMRSLGLDVSGSIGEGRTHEYRAGALPGQAAVPELEAARRAYADAARAEQERLRLAESTRDAELRIREEKIRSIEAQERLVESAQRQYEVEQKKLQSFQAQVGALSAVEQQQLKDIRDKLRAGQDISALEEEFLATQAGEQGRAIADKRRADRGAAAGFDENFFAGIDGASDGMKDAAKALEDAVKALKDLTAGTSAAEAKARLEKEKKELEAQYQDFYKSAAKQIETLSKLLETVNQRLSMLEEAAAHGR